MASAAALWLGRGGLDPATGAALPGPTPHASLGGGCVACHQAGPTALERGAGHAFVADRASCARCHATALPIDDLAVRARMLWTAWRTRAGQPAASGSDPPHAAATRLDRATPLGRAASMSIAPRSPCSFFPR